MYLYYRLSKHSGFPIVSGMSIVLVNIDAPKKKRSLEFLLVKRKRRKLVHFLFHFF